MDEIKIKKTKGGTFKVCDSNNDRYIINLKNVKIVNMKPLKLKLGKQDATRLIQIEDKIEEHIAAHTELARCLCYNGVIRVKNETEIPEDFQKKKVDVSLRCGHIYMHTTSGTATYDWTLEHISKCDTDVDVDVNFSEDTEELENPEPTVDDLEQIRHEYIEKLETKLETKKSQVDKLEKLSQDLKSKDFLPLMQQLDALLEDD